MKTSLSDFLRQYSEKDFSRFHMPGHKGNCDFLGSIGVKEDITEIAGADCLYEANGCLGDLERSLSSLYSSDCYLCAGGSTLCIQAMLYLCRFRKIFAVRSAHASFFHAAALLGLNPEFLPITVSETTGLCKQPSASSLEKILKNSSEPAAVYITSPDYWGNTADIKALAEICHKNGALLIVDNAHGAHTKFLPSDSHPISLGADICSDSLHKTLPAFTGAALLHIRHNLFSNHQVKRSMAVFGSTSPSYLILLSIERCCDYLKKSAVSDFYDLSKKKERFLNVTQIPVLPTDCVKLTIDTFALGYHGNELASLLRRNSIEPEWVQDRYIILLLSPFLRECDWKRLTEFFINLPKKGPIAENLSEPFFKPVKRLSLREAMLSPQESISVLQAVGKVSGETVFRCPPGIPPVVAGEELTENLCKTLKNSGISEINVIK